MASATRGYAEDALGVKLRNRKRVYGYIWAHHQASRQELVSGLRISLPTVTQNLNYLQEQGLIDATRQIRYTGGRNATAYTVLPDARRAIGVSLTRNHISVMSQNLLGEPGTVLRRKMTFKLKSDAYLKKIGAMVEEVRRKDRIREEDLLGVGVAVPGLVSEDGSVVVDGPTMKFTGTRCEDVCRYVPYRSRMFHDSYTAGYAEMMSRPELDNAFYITLGTSVGGSLIYHHTIMDGDHFKAGEVGHTKIVPKSQKLCYCGQRGCYDTVGSITVLDSYTDGDLGEFFRLLKEGDKKAARMWDTYLGYLATVVHNTWTLFDVPVIIGGYLGTYIDEYIDDLRERVDALSSHPWCPASEYVLPSVMKIEPVAAGAARYFIDEFLEGIAIMPEETAEVSAI